MIVFVADDSEKRGLCKAQEGQLHVDIIQKPFGYRRGAVRPVGPVVIVGGSPVIVIHIAVALVDFEPDIAVNPQPTERFDGGADTKHGNPVKLPVQLAVFMAGVPIVHEFS